MLVRGIGVIVAFTCALSGRAPGAELYTLTATTTSVPPLTATASGSNLQNLLQDAAASRKDFAALKGQDVTMSLSAAGRRGVMTLTRNAAGTSATLTIPSIGVSRTFTAASAPKLTEEIGHYLRKNVDNALARLNEKLQQLTKVAAVDGNPHSATAFVADAAFFQWGLPEGRVNAGNGWWLSGSGGSYRADGISGVYGDVGIGGDIPVGDRAAISLGFTSQYEQIGRANSYTLGDFQVGVPITLYKTLFMDGLTWQATPFGYGMAVISPGTLSGGGVYGGGGVSSLTWAHGPLALTLGDQISYFAGANLGLEGRVYGNRELDQWILKNGIKATYSMNQHLFIDGSITYTNFLNKAGVPDYLTPTLGIGWRLSPGAAIHVGYHGDYAKGYSGTGGDISLTVSY